MQIQVITQEYDGEVTIDFATSQKETDRIAYEAQNVDWRNSDLTDRPETWETTENMLLKENAIKNCPECRTLKLADGRCECEPEEDEE